MEGRLLISDRAHLVLPYHKLLDGESPRSREIGTTSRGIGPAYEDKIGRRGVRAGDLRDAALTEALVRSGCARANAVLQQWGSAQRCDPEHVTAALRDLAPRILPYLADAGRVVWTALRDGDNVLLEGAQGALLDVDHGTYPFVTSSNTTAGGAIVGAGIGPMSVHAVLGVLKAYTTRVGNGPLPTEAPAVDGERLRRLGDEYGATTGRPRRCGWFDAVVARYSSRVNGLTDLAITKLDVLDTIDPIPVCTHYLLDGERSDDLPDSVAELARVQPVYEPLAGWLAPTGGVRRLGDLPVAARRYLARLEALAATRVRYVGVGPRRAQLIEVS
jgi:adenylosuccinate synthase